MTYQELYNNILKKRSFLCIGLDSNMALLPTHLLDEEYPLFQFNREIIDATHHLAVAYKPNLAFYEAEGSSGWRQLEMTVDYIKAKDPSLFVIADAKRGDIGNTSRMYASAFLERMECDAVTIAPYMGRDSVAPFLEYEGKWAILLALTSNPSAADFELQRVVAKADANNLEVSTSTKPLYQIVMERAQEWGSEDNLMFVVGATQAEELKRIREIAPNHFLLVPGVGAQGGSLEGVARYGLNDHCGLLVNLSRQIIYAWREEGSKFNGRQFGEAAALAAEKIATEMSQWL